MAIVTYQPADDSATVLKKIQSTTKQPIQVFGNNSPQTITCYGNNSTPTPTPTPTHIPPSTTVTHSNKPPTTTACPPPAVSCKLYIFYLPKV